ncbi:hypothetical protein [Undibacterium pigrum]|uniref:Uncharacterized protein n=1 Tax=Undibacterium pigrum TaxID=401470 RepID=A0A318J886_9BURK|nr:hypothetical protein [Undibacterium pigrum]PXX45309.1 hypothetical protein DFR42_102537 [Undibacterium pigrum]
MYRYTFQIVISILLSIFPVLVIAGTAATDAEFAIRWNVATGGPKTADDVIKLLGLPEVEADNYEVSYFSVAVPAGVPKADSIIARQRIKGEKTQLMIKYRNKLPLHDKFTISRWECPLGQKAESKYEADITLLFNKKSKAFYSQPAYSLSCSLKAKEKISFPTKLNAKQLGYSRTMVRYESEDIKIEEWTSTQCKEKFIEVSKSAKNTDTDYQAFVEKVGVKLIDAGIKPEATSKSSKGAGSCTG